MKKVLSTAIALLILCTGCSSKTDTKIQFDTRNDDMTEMSSVELVADMDAGWNLGDTLDVCQADRDGDGKVNETAAPGEAVDETLWGNPKTTPELFQHLKADGIGAVRIPVTWRDHLSEDNQIDPAWLARVHEVVNYAYDLDLYVILNVHHDGGGDPDFGAWIRTDEAGFVAVREKYQTIWQQIAESFSGYDQHLILESMNEVGFDNVAEDKAYEMLTTLNQDFVDLVRKSGGNNDKRHLLIAGYWTDIQKTCDGRFQMPEDPADHCILSVHYYTPYEFCINGSQKTWGNGVEVRRMENDMERLTQRFVENGTPVIIGEYGTSTHVETESRVRFCGELVRLSRQQGMTAFFWDNGEEYDREALTWRTPGLQKAITEGAEEE